MACCYVLVRGWPLIMKSASMLGVSMSRLSSLNVSVFKKPCFINTNIILLLHKMQRQVNWWKYFEIFYILKNYCWSRSLHHPDLATYYCVVQLKKIKDLPTVDNLTREMYYEYFPDVEYQEKTNPTMWPHTRWYQPENDPDTIWQWQ